MAVAHRHAAGDAERRGREPRRRGRGPRAAGRRRSRTARSPRPRRRADVVRAQGVEPLGGAASSRAARPASPTRAPRPRRPARAARAGSYEVAPLGAASGSARGRRTRARRAARRRARRAPPRGRAPRRRGRRSASSRRAGRRSGTKTRGESRVARSVKSVCWTQPAARATSPCQPPYQRCLESITAAGMAQHRHEPRRAPSSSAQRRQSGRNQRQPRVLDDQVAGARRTARRARRAARRARAGSSAGLRRQRPRGRAGRRTPARRAARSSRVWKSTTHCDSPKPRGFVSSAGTSGCGTWKPSRWRMPENRLVPLRPEPATRTSGSAVVLPRRRARCAPG